MSASPQAKQARILVCDDDPHARTIASVMLKHAGYERITETADPLNAIRRVEKGLVDLLILDWRLPQMTGIEVLRAVRAQQGKVPVVMLTAHKEREHVMEALQAGANDYVAKPFSGTVLVNKVTAVLNSTFKKA
ncbi:MAG: response regulator [Bdellovibrionales bacterium]|nr:response regulator [Bdellovibrionales bacterium]